MHVDKRTKHRSLDIDERDESGGREVVPHTIKIYMSATQTFNLYSAVPGRLQDEDSVHRGEHVKKTCIPNGIVR